MTKLQTVGSLEVLCDSNNKHSGIAHLKALFGGLFLLNNIMIPSDAIPVCKVPGCQLGASVLSKKGDNMRYMLTCRKHWYGQILKQGTKTA